MDFLDAIVIVSFMMQLQSNEMLRKQTTNDDLHSDVDRLERKLDTLIEMLSTDS